MLFVRIIDLSYLCSMFYFFFVCNILVVFQRFFFFKQKTAYEMRISDWSSDGVLFRSLDQPDFGWPTKWQDWFEARLADGKAYLEQTQASPAKVGPSLDLARYAGRYRDPWYGDVVIGSTAKGLTIDFTSTPRMAGRLKHWQYDSFVTDFDDPAIEDRKSTRLNS